MRDLIAVIEGVVGKPARIVSQPDQPGDVPLTYANIDRARALLGYEPSVPIDLGVHRFYEWFAGSS